MQRRAAAVTIAADRDAIAAHFAPAAATNTQPQQEACPLGWAFSFIGSFR